MWAVCAALAISGITTAVQAARVGRVGSGYVMLMGSSSAFLAVCLSALEQGGPGLLATSVRHNQFHDTDVITVRVEPVHA